MYLDQIILLKYIVDAKPCPCPWTLSFSCVAGGQETPKWSTTNYQIWHHLLHHQVNWCPWQWTLTYMIRSPCPSSFSCSRRQSNPEPAKPYIRTQVCSSYNITSRKKHVSVSQEQTGDGVLTSLALMKSLQIKWCNRSDLPFHLEWWTAFSATHLSWYVSFKPHSRSAGIKNSSSLNISDWP